MMNMARPVKSGISQSVLVDMYVTQKLSQSEIAERLGTTQGNVHYHMKAMGIPARHEDNNREYCFDPEDLRRMYSDQKIKMRDIAIQLGCSYSTVRSELIGAGVVIRPKSNNRKYRPTAHKPGRTVDQGYEMVRVEGHPFAKKRGHYVSAHRLVVEKAIGRYLGPDEHVHHINVVRSDREIKNLAVLDSSQHARVHKYMCHVAAYLCGLTETRPPALDFGSEVFWGGRYLASIDLLSWISADQVRQLNATHAAVAAATGTVRDKDPAETIN